MSNIKSNDVDSDPIVYRYDILPFPNIDLFYNLLQDRLHSILGRLYLDHPFTIFITALAREKIIPRIARKELSHQDLISGGIDMQRELLEYERGGKKYKDLDKYWEVLKNTKITGKQEGTVSSQLYDEYIKGDLDLTDIPERASGTMKSYFSILQTEESKPGINEELFQRRNAEYQIIKTCLSVEDYRYMSIPLIQFAELDGVAHIVMHISDQNNILDNQTGKIRTKVISNIIKSFSNEYESVILNWDLVEENSSKFSAVTNAIEVAELIAEKANDPIFKELEFHDYYKKHRTYFLERIKISNAIPELYYQQNLKNAITTILLDSYAHNISAHSLTTLSWWFRERFEYKTSDDGKKMLEDFGRDNNPLILYSKYYSDRTLSKELYPLFKFLLEKGAFWSGITRETNRTGKNSNMFNILWYDFINNPLYLGTIANTEEIFKLHIAITIYESEEETSQPYENIKQIKKVDNVLLDHIFVTINLEDFEQDKPNDPKKSVFVEEGAHFEIIKRELQQYKAFFPGGVVGKHAFFTLLENEIRNVKHFKDEKLEQIQKDGLILNISIHERPAFPEKEDQLNQLYKIGVWLKHPVDIDNQLLLKRINDLGGDIITEDNYQPKLGGNYQDKICAAMLMESTFEAVQNKASSIGKVYYPWIKTASSPFAINTDLEKSHELEVSHRKFIQLADKLPDGKLNLATATQKLKSHIQHLEGPGYLKKYFHLWKGADVLKIPDETAIQMESPARYRFVCLSPVQKDLVIQLKAEGLIRVLRTDHCSENITQAYEQWIPAWLKSEKEDYVIDFREGQTLISRLLYQKGKVDFVNKTDIEKVELDNELYEQYRQIPHKLAINVAHGGKTSTAADKINYRTHGRLVSSFCEGQPMSKINDMKTDKAYELFEAITTRVTVFDRRLYNRLYVKGGKNNKLISEDKLNVQKGRLEAYRNCLLLDFRSETVEHWEVVKKQGVLNQHFLLLHLSFIESMKDNEGNNTYSEDRIIDFINEQILQGQPPEIIGDNFILAITTGRGRMAWWEVIKKEPRYARFVTFRPIESIIAAVENALQISDDFDLKYNMVKLLFGS